MFELPTNFIQIIQIFVPLTRRSAFKAKTRLSGRVLFCAIERSFSGRVLYCAHEAGHISRCCQESKENGGLNLLIELATVGAQGWA